jgi:hypothetical protein
VCTPLHLSSSVKQRLLLQSATCHSAFGVVQPTSITCTANCTALYLLALPLCYISCTKQGTPIILDAAVSRASLTTRTSGTLNRNYSSITMPSSSAGGFQLKEQPEREAVAHALSAATRAAATAAAADGSSSGSRSKHTSSRAAAAASATPAYLHTRSGATPLSAARGSASQQQAMLDAVLGKPGNSSSSRRGSSSTAAAARGLTPAAARLAKKLKQSVSASPFGGALNGSSSSSRMRQAQSANFTPLASPSPVAAAAGKHMSATAKGKQKASKKAATGGLTDGLLKL